MNFLKKLIKNNDLKDSKKEIEKIPFEEIENWVKKKEKEIEDKGEESLILIKDKISKIINDLKERINILENINVESKNEEERIKSIVKESLNNYIIYIKDLVKNVDNLEEEKDLERFIVKINNIFSEFNKRSHQSYQKTTLLIGKEMGDTKNIIYDFLKDLEKIFNENKEIIDSSKLLFSIKSNLEKIIETDQIIKDLNNKIKSLDEKIINNKEINEKILSDIEKMKSSESYIENLKKKEEIKPKLEDLEKEIFRLKEMIDFKNLGNIFHVDEEKMNIIKDYKKNFQLAFQKDSGKNILNLLDESKLNSKSILNKIDLINKIENEIIENEKMIKEDETENLMSKTKEIRIEIDKLDNEKTNEMKKYEKLKRGREELISPIKQELSKLNVVISVS